MSVIGLLSALAMPVYQTAQARSQRQLAKLALMKSAQWLEQTATTQGSYPANLPASVWQTPELKYRINVSSQSQTYVLTAVPLGNQQTDDCGSLTLNQTGQRGAQGDAALCWSK
jgi:type IV pilus assembly protein PilE